MHRRVLLSVCATLVCTSLVMVGEAADKKETTSVLNHKMKSISGQEVDLAKKYEGKVVLFVNVASACGYTPQYEGLQALHEKYSKDGLAIVGVPCNQFGAQEPGTEEEIAKFCKSNYGVTFDMLSKVDVNGEKQCGLYKQLTSKETNAKSPGAIKWNFEKFLIGRDGQIAGRFASGVAPDSNELVSAIETALKK